MKNKYIAPDKNLKSFTCPHCQTLSLMEWNTHFFGQDLVVDEEGNPMFRYDSFNEEVCDYYNKLTIARCHNCGNKII